MTAQVGNLRAIMGARIQVGKDLSYHSPVISHEKIWMPRSIVLVILIMIQKLFYIACFYPEVADCVFFGSSGKTMWISLEISCYLMVIKPLSKPWLFTIIHFASGLLSNLLGCMVSQSHAFYEYQKPWMVLRSLRSLLMLSFWTSLISFCTLQICSDLKYSQENVL